MRDGLDELMDEAEARKRAARQKYSTGTNGSGPRLQPTSSDPRVAKAFREDIDLLARETEGQRNHELNRVAGNLGRLPINRNELHDALMGACGANGLLADDGAYQCEATIRSGFDFADREGPRTMPPLKPRLVAVSDDWVETSTPTKLSIAETEEDFWQSRDSLRHIYGTSLSRYCSPWAVLAVTVAEVLCAVGPEVTLPPLIGGPGSLNWFAALAARSGGGKGSAMRCARDLLPPLGTAYKNLGSGEGLVKAYRTEVTADTPDGLLSAVLFQAEEIDAMTALGGRSGATLMPMLRMAFSGEQLGFSYAGQGRDLHLPADSYRLCLLASAQPARAGALLDDHSGGTPQRFMWFPATDGRIGVEFPEVAEGVLAVPDFDELSYRGAVEVAVADCVEAEIKSARSAAMRDEANALDGHALYCREKFAYGLALLDGRTDAVTEEDWRLASITSRVSDATRDWIERLRVEVTDDEQREKGRQRGIVNAAAAQEKSHQDAKRVGRVKKWMLDQLGKGPVTPRDLRHRMASRDRDLFEVVLGFLQQDGLVKLDGGKWMKTTTTQEDSE